MIIYLCMNMNAIHQCIQKISPGNHFCTYGTGRTGRTDKGDAICPPPPITNGGGHKKNRNCMAGIGIHIYADAFLIPYTGVCKQLFRLVFLSPF